MLIYTEVLKMARKIVDKLFYLLYYIRVVLGNTLLEVESFTGNLRKRHERNPRKKIFEFLKIFLKNHKKTVDKTFYL
jgi:hypothetical protein